MLLREACLLLGLLSVCLATTADLRQQNPGGETGENQKRREKVTEIVMSKERDIRERCKRW